MFLQDACGQEQLVVTAASYINICLMQVDYFTCHNCQCSFYSCSGKFCTKASQIPFLILTQQCHVSSISKPDDGSGDDAEDCDVVRFIFPAPFSRRKNTLCRIYRRLAVSQGRPGGCCCYCCRWKSNSFSHLFAQCLYRKFDYDDKSCFVGHKVMLIGQYLSKFLRGFIPTSSGYERQKKSLTL